MTATTRPARVDVEQLVQEELSWSRTPHPHRIAEAVAGRLDDSQLRPALAAALAHVVRRVATRQRARASGVVEDRQADVRQLAAQPVYFGAAGAGGGWRRFGDCTMASLAQTVRHRREVAEQEAAYTARLERLIEALDAAGVATVDELGMAGLAAIFT